MNSKVLTRPKNNVLVVDDSPANLRLLSTMLTEQGYKVRPAPSGAHALATSKREAPDLILLDVMMPKIDGLEVLRRVKESRPEIEVVMITAVMLTGENNPTLGRDMMFSVLMIVLNGMLSSQSNAELQRKLRRLAREFDALNNDDAALDLDQRQGALHLVLEFPRLRSQSACRVSLFRSVSRVSILQQ